ncbi:MAG: ADP-ribosylglycohydrolase family protein [Limnochordia bacterium]|jgi:ADP-ribosylglycohydrolase
MIATLLGDELQAKRDDDGCTPESLYDLQKRYEAIKERGSRQELEALYMEVQRLQPHKSDYWEPSDLEGIKQARPPGPRAIPAQLSDDELLDRIYGGWLGRAAGCTLGKPVEGWSRAQIETYLAALGEADINDYIPFADLAPETLPRTINLHLLSSCRGHIRYAPQDDDLDYTVIGLHVLKTRGMDFTTRDIADLWLHRLPYYCTYTAERAAYRNLVEGRTPPETAYYRNPYRQWIGAQIRADSFGYAAPGLPELAAEFAWRDARLSHVKNGIYGEMWVAAAIAAAFTTNDIQTIISTATAEIPTDSRFAHMVADMLTWHKTHKTWQECHESIVAKYGRLSKVHTINNAALVLLAMLYGENDLGKTISIAVQSGWDTDCNGATAGSIIGVMLGAHALPPQWVQPLNDTLNTAIFGYSLPKISDLAHSSAAVARRVLDQAMHNGV